MSMIITTNRDLKPVVDSQRETAAVLSLLRQKMDSIVTSYPPHIFRVPNEPIVGTAFFPGGCGLWCGLEPFAPAPKMFPNSPVIFIAHNYSGEKAFYDLRNKGGEIGDKWWPDKVLALLRGAGVDPTEAFFTNALMGLKDGPSLGDMRATPEFEAECTEFLREQIRIVQPSKIVAFGNDASRRVKLATREFARCIHPSAREFVKLETRANQIQLHSTKLREELAKLS
jgi:hypothetical protein